MDIPMILTKRYEGSEWTLKGDNYSGLTWLSDTPKPTAEELQAEWAQVEYETACDRVEVDRQVAYRETADPIFFEFQRGDMLEQDWLDAVEAVKVAHPYPVDPSTVVPEPEIVPEIVVDEVVEDGA